jgi:hypothetical protein
VLAANPPSLGHADVKWITVRFDGNVRHSPCSGLSSDDRAVPTKGEVLMLAEQFDAFLLDLDGVVYLGAQIVNG